MRARARYSRRCVIATSDVATRVPRVLLAYLRFLRLARVGVPPEQFLRTNNSVKCVSALNNGRRPTTTRPPTHPKHFRGDFYPLPKPNLSRLNTGKYLKLNYSSVVSSQTHVHSKLKNIYYSGGIFRVHFHSISCIIMFRGPV